MNLRWRRTRPLRPRLGIGIVGCGHIAAAYSAAIAKHPQMALLGFADIVPARAQDHARRYGGQAYPELVRLVYAESNHGRIETWKTLMQFLW